MLEADLRQADEALETVGVDCGTGCDMLGQERDYVADYPFSQRETAQ